MACWPRRAGSSPRCPRRGADGSATTNGRTVPAEGRGRFGRVLPRTPPVRQEAGRVGAARRPPGVQVAKTPRPANGAKPFPLAAWPFPLALPLRAGSTAATPSGERTKRRVVRKSDGDTPW